MNLKQFREKIFGDRRRLIIVLAILFLLYPAFISGLATNPPGFYVDESCLAYNGYLIATTGAAENGTSFPLFFQCYTESLVQYAHPTNIYLLAGMYLFVAPSVLSARILAATTVFVAMLLLGMLAFRITGRPLIGCLISITALATPWIFEISRLVLETYVIVLSLVLFLLSLHSAHKRKTWKLSDAFFLAISLSLITYSYTPGRLLGPAFAVGLLIFATDRPSIWNIVKVWGLYSLALIPLFVVSFANSDLVTKRLSEVTYILPDRSWFAIVTEFVVSFFSDLSPVFLLVVGDPIKRHHVGGMGEIFAATFILAVAGVILILLRHRSDPWWRFILFGLIVSVVPGAITIHRHHALRLLALPIFVLILTIPALSFLIDGLTQGSAPLKVGPLPKRIILTSLLLLTLGQAVYFQYYHREFGPKFGHMFNASYPRVLNVAIAHPSRPIYLRDGQFGGVAYIHAYWYGAIKGIDPSNFVHLPQGAEPPVGSLLLSSDLGCTKCTTIFQDDNFSLNQTR